MKDSTTRSTSEMSRAKVVAASSLAILIALYVVGAVSVPPGSLRHEVQTLPLWFPIVAGFQNKELAKWAALPSLIFWLVIMIFIWLFLLGFPSPVRGRFFPTEVAMTIVVGIASLTGLIASLRWPTRVGLAVAISTFFLFGLLQLLAMRISLLPYIAGR